MKTAFLGLLALAAVGVAGSFWVRARPGPEAKPVSKAHVTRDASGKEWTYDEQGRLIQVVEPIVPGSTFPSRSTDEMVMPVAPDGKASTYTFEKNCTYGEQRNPQGLRIEYLYDANGNLAQTVTQN